MGEHINPNKCDAGAYSLLATGGVNNMKLFKSGWLFDSVRLALTGGVIALVFVGSSFAAYSDVARLNVGPDGLGSTAKFDIGVVSPTSTFAQATTAGSVLIPVTGGDALVPGRSVTTDVVVANNSQYKAALAVAVVAGGTGNTGAVGAAPNITSFLRFSVQDLTTNAYLFGGAAPAAAVPIASASGTTGPLTGRVAAPLADGAVWVPGAAGSFRTLRVTIVYPDTPAANNSFNGGRSALLLSITGSSV
jgi:hypothetical protein